MYTEKHPHVRGEDLQRVIQRVRRMETPPRAWGRLEAMKKEMDEMRKHPHVRGEDVEI